MSVVTLSSSKLLQTVASEEAGLGALNTAAFLGNANHPLYPTTSAKLLSSEDLVAPQSKTTSITLPQPMASTIDDLDFSSKTGCSGWSSPYFRRRGRPIHDPPPVKEDLKAQSDLLLKQLGQLLAYLLRFFIR